jgi:hypothetical protein
MHAPSLASELSLQDRINAAPAKNDMYEYI